jgi:hypothetical protein
MTVNLKCPFCSHAVTLGENDLQVVTARVKVGTADEDELIGIKASAYKCPNPDCRKIGLEVGAGFGRSMSVGGYPQFGGIFNGVFPDKPVGAGYFRFAPRVATPLSNHVPEAVRTDYEEACSIKDLSPKAAATLCRRALQGMIRDFHGVTKQTLHEELKSI